MISLILLSGFLFTNSNDTLQLAVYNSISKLTKAINSYLLITINNL